MSEWCLQHPWMTLLIALSILVTLDSILCDFARRPYNDKGSK